MENTKLVVEKIVNEIAQVYKQNLISDGKVASGELVRSIAPMPVEETSEGYIASISAVDYARFVESGRRPGKFPPPNKILNWVKTRFPAASEIRQQQISFLVARKIAKLGIPAGNQLQNAINQVYPKYNKEIDEAIMKDLQLI